MENRNITILGPVNMDVLARPVDFSRMSAGSIPMEQIRVGFGGNALNEAVTLNRLGTRVQLVTRIGCDDAGEQLMHFLDREKLATDAVRRDSRYATSVNIVLITPDGERFFLTDPGSCMRTMTPEDYLPFLDTAADLVCFPGMFVSPMTGIREMETLFRQVHEKPGRVLAADMTRPKQGETLRDLAHVLPWIDYFFPNETEAALLTGKNDVYENARMLVDAGVRCVVIKRGALGCLVRTAGACMEIPAFPVSRVVDTTGARDTFAAGFLHALLCGYSLRDCALFASAAASCAVECLGANDGIRSPEIPLERFRTLCAGQDA